MITLKDRVYGSLYGFAIGDAMGATTEFMSREAIKNKYGRVESIIGGGWLGLRAGEVTDDTQMMICVADAIMDSERTDTPALNLCCQYFRSWLRMKPVDVGNTCFTVISNCYTNNPTDWYKYGEDFQRYKNTEFLGNGGLMRCLVPCLLGYRELAVNQSKLTHNNKTCNYYASRYYSIVNSFFHRSPSYLPDVDLMEPTGCVINTYSNCTHWLSSTGTFEDAILNAVNDGGDADTIAALTGGLVGARYGIGSIPEDWIQSLDVKTCMKLEAIAKYVIEKRTSRRDNEYKGYL